MAWVARERIITQHFWVSVYLQVKRSLHIYFSQRASQATKSLRDDCLLATSCKWAYLDDCYSLNKLKKKNSAWWVFADRVSVREFSLEMKFWEKFQAMYRRFNLWCLLILAIIAILRPATSIKTRYLLAMAIYSRLLWWNIRAWKVELSGISRKKNLLRARDENWIYSLSLVGDFDLMCSLSVDRNRSQYSFGKLWRGKLLQIVSILTIDTYFK